MEITITWDELEEAIRAWAKTLLPNGELDQIGSWTVKDDENKVIELESITIPIIGKNDSVSGG